jgi:hypothetical protein
MRVGGRVLRMCWMSAKCKLVALGLVLLEMKGFRICKLGGAVFIEAWELSPLCWT